MGNGSGGRGFTRRAFVGGGAMVCIPYVARAQMTVLQAGREPKALTDAELEMIDKHEMREFHVDKLWRFYTQKAIKQGIVEEHADTFFH